MERRFIEQTKEMYKEDYTRETMTYYLKEAGADPDQIPAILDTAWAEYVTARTTKYKVVNKLVFYITIGLIAAVLIVFIGLLPGRDIIVGRIPLFSFLATALICLFGFYAITFRNTWKSPYVEKHGKVKVHYAFIVATFVPGVILYFIFSARFSMAQDAMLKDSQVEALGHVVYGQSVGARRIIGGGEVNYSSITVSFQTQKGDSVIVTKQVPAYQFKNFYKGEEIHLIYSKDNPRNIDLLADDQSIRNFRHTEQRALGMSDLLRLAAVDPQQLSTELNKISYGWALNSGKNVYVNEHFQNEISADGHGLIFAGPQEDRMTFPDSLKAIGFTQVGKDDPNDLFQTGPKVFENAKFRVTLTVKRAEGDGNGVAIVMIAHK